MTYRFNCLLCNLFAKKSAVCVACKMSCVLCVCMCMCVCVCVCVCLLLTISLLDSLTLHSQLMFSVVFIHISLTFTFPESWELCLWETKFIAVIYGKLQCAKVTLEKSGKERVAIEPSTALSIGQIYSFILGQPLGIFLAFCVLSYHK